MTWTSLHVHPGPDRAAAMEALFAAGAQGVQEDGDDLVTHFAADVDVQPILSALGTAAPSAVCEVGAAEDTDWSRGWRDRIAPKVFARIVVSPPWLAGQFDPARTVVIDPGMAFGTGDHPSTRGAIRLLQEEVRPGSVAADLGSGSAVLSIAAARLGAARVFAIEADADAAPNAAANVALNGVGDVVHLLDGDAAILLPLVAPVDLVVANILSSALVELLPAIHRALSPAGRAVLAGILIEERKDVLSACAGDGWRLVAEDSEDGWWSATIEKP